MVRSTPDSIVALIPARSGSKRLPGKNIHILQSHPIIAYTISAAITSGIFKDIIVSTDSEEYADIARSYGAKAPFLRPKQFSTETSPDIEWVNHALQVLYKSGNKYECYSILRPTSPFRKARTIQRAWREFREEHGVDSLRAVEVASQHPGKMWYLLGSRMFPLLPQLTSDPPWHSSQTNTLPKVYVQNASLEIAWTDLVLDSYSISGTSVMPFITEGDEGFDINTPYDLEIANQMIENGNAELPEISMGDMS